MKEFFFDFMEGPLGMTLKSTTSKYGAAIVDCFNNNPDGSIGQAEKVKKNELLLITNWDVLL